MVSYFYGAPQPDLEKSKEYGSEVVVGEPLPDGLAQIDAAEKSRILAKIDENKYVRRHGAWQTRAGYGPRDFLVRVITLSIFFILAYISRPESPRGREDKEWLITLSFMAVILYAILHTLAYVPTALFHGISDFMNAVRGRVSHAYENWRDYHYCAALIVAVVAIYPIFAFFALIVNGFDPYEDLTPQEMAKKGGLQSDMLYMLRVGLHGLTVLFTIYLFLMSVVLVFIRSYQRYPGHMTWAAIRLSKMPYGSLLFQEGEFFDCGICIAGIWKGSDVVRLGCDEKHVFHVQCLRDQIAIYGNKYCILCPNPVPVMVVNPPAPETVQ